MLRLCRIISLGCAKIAFSHNEAFMGRSYFSGFIHIGFAFITEKKSRFVSKFMNPLEFQNIQNGIRLSTMNIGQCACYCASKNCNIYFMLNGFCHFGFLNDPKKLANFAINDMQVGVKIKDLFAVLKVLNEKPFFINSTAGIPPIDLDMTMDGFSNFLKFSLVSQ